MIKLMKYELRKTLPVKLMLLGVTCLVELFFLAGLFLEKESLTALGASLLTGLAFTGVTVMGLSSILTLHRDMNTKQSYMLFITPNSCYKILGAKVLENGLSILLAGAFYFALGVLDITLLFSRLGQIQDLWGMVNSMLAAMGEQIPLNTKGFASLAFLLLTSWISTVTTAYLADVVASALLNGKKFAGALCFVLFLLINTFTGWVASQIVRGVSDIITSLLARGCLGLAFSVIMYVASAMIMEKKLSV